MPPDQQFSFERIAEMASLELTPESMAHSQQELLRILDFVAVLDELDLSDIEPFYGTMESVLLNEAPYRRNDEVQPSTPRDEILGNAPDQDGEFYHVPPVFD